MKISEKEKKMTISVYGREMTFSEQELIAILEEHFAKETTNQSTVPNVLQIPTEGKWFSVDPQAIDRNLFQQKRPESKQEITRKLILDALSKVDKNPKRYGRKFKTMTPEKTWLTKTCYELEKLASELGNHNADKYEQALEWAQRICNGESWEDLCNKADTSNWYRLVLWKDDYARLVGGSRESHYSRPASYVSSNCYNSNSRVLNVVPLVVLYEK